jgi:hypothetical protein
MKIWDLFNKKIKSPKITVGKKMLKKANSKKIGVSLFL